MKKILLSALIASASFGAYAQQVLMDGDMNIVPGAFTADGKATLISFNDKTFEARIYDEALNVSKRFNVNRSGEYTRKDYLEIATIKPTKVQVTDRNEVKASYYNSDTGGYVSDLRATNVTELLQVCVRIGSGSYEGNTGWITFTDDLGRVSCYHESYSCFGDSWISTVYPHKYFCIIDGYVWEVSCQYDYVVEQEDLDAAEWTVEGDVDTWTGGGYLQGGLFDYDNNVENSGKTLALTQNIFNDDDKWEYLIPIRGKNVKSPGDAWKWGGSSADGIVYRRDVTERSSIEGYAIYNEDNSKLAEIHPSGTFSNIELYGIYKLNGKLLLEFTAKETDGDWTDIVCLYDPTSSEIRQISSSKSARFFNVEGRTINFNADSNADAALFSMNGMKVASSRANGKKLSIDARNVPAGVYNVTLTKNGRVERSQKIVLK